MSSSARLITFRLATDDDKELPTYDHTKLSAFNTCPTWGIIRYAHHRRFATISRAMALEAGTAMHEVFAFVRLITLARQCADRGETPRFINLLMDNVGIRLFGQERWASIIDASPMNEDVDTRLRHDVITVLETSGFYDDERDKRRTLTNLEECALAYVDRWDYRPLVWMRDVCDPLSDVGIEIPFDVVVEQPDEPSFRFTGKLDGLRYAKRRGEQRLIVEDNKTGSRLNEAWEMSFDTSHQLTGYALAASVFAGEQVRDAEAIGLAIPLPRSEFNGYVRAQTTRSEEQLSRFVAWMLYTVDGFRRMSTDPLNAPMFTHSCSRYFRPCSLIPFCASSQEERAEMFNEMIVDEWSPLHTMPILEGE